MVLCNNLFIISFKYIILLQYFINLRRNIIFNNYFFLFFVNIVRMAQELLF